MSLLVQRSIKGAAGLTEGCVSFGVAALEGGELVRGVSRCSASVSGDELCFGRLRLESGVLGDMRLDALAWAIGRSGEGVGARMTSAAHANKASCGMAYKVGNTVYALTVRINTVHVCQNARRDTSTTRTTGT